MFFLSCIPRESLYSSALEQPSADNAFIISDIKLRVATWIKTYRSSKDPVVVELVKKLSAVYKAKILPAEKKLSKLKDPTRSKIYNDILKQKSELDAIGKQAFSEKLEKISQLEGLIEKFENL